MPRTMALDRTSWDIVLDAAGNIAVADEPYAQAQDIASACKLFAGELWYNQTKGVPYFSKVLGQFPDLNALRGYWEEAALTVSGVTTATAYITAYDSGTRQLTGQVQGVNTAGQIAATDVVTPNSSAPSDFNTDFTSDFS
jgi:hypothetical protein